jgi:ABC-type xylose transport system permease subunit
VLAAGLTLLIAAGEIDLSFPSIVALSGWVLAYCIHDHQAPWLGLILALAAGALVGLARDVTPGIAVAIEATLDAELLKRNGKLAVIAPPTAWLGLVMRR